MNYATLILPIACSLFVIAVCTYLLMSGFNHTFLLLFALAALLHEIPPLGYAALQSAPGGFGANMRWVPGLSAVGIVGTLCSIAAFLSLASYLLKNRPAHPPELPR